MVLAAIIACEVAFWVAIAAGLATRYLLREPRPGAAFLLLAPVIDVALLALVTVDLSRGATASWHHGLAAIYLGVSVAYGRRMVAWADLRFAHLFAGGPAPEKLSGLRYTLKCWRDAGLTLLAVAIAAAILGGMIWLVDDPARTTDLGGMFRILGIILAIDVVWAVGHSVWPKAAPAAQDTSPH